MPKKKPPPESMIQLITDVNQLDLQFYEWAVPLYEKRVAAMKKDPRWTVSKTKIYCCLSLSLIYLLGKGIT